MRILINTPRLISQGGVANHYIGLSHYWKEKVLYNPIGKRSSKSGSGLYYLPIDIFIFLIKIIFFKPDVIMLNPSLSYSALKRDMLFLKIARLCRKKIVVFFHGFNVDNISSLNIPSLVKSLNKSKFIFVLAEEFKEIMQSWGVTVPILLTTTKVDDRMIEEFDIETRKGMVKNILFLSRITEKKGIFIALEAFSISLKQYPYLQLRIVGDGSALACAKKWCQERSLANVLFLGALSGNRLIDEYVKADIYIFPTYTEGMPTTVLEAMAFGLPVITRPVGGICDFFENGEMGTLIDSFDPKDFAKAICSYVNSPESVRRISYLNYGYAREHFMASIVARNIESTLSKYIR